MVDAIRIVKRSIDSKDEGLHVKQDESNGDPKFITTIGLRGKLSSH